MSRLPFAAKLLSTLAVVLAAATFAKSAHAGDVLQYQAGERVDPQEVAHILGVLDTPAASADANKPNALSLPVKFAFDSFEILPEGKAQLDALAEGIKLLPPTQSVVIEGHTDARGPDEYNMALSKQRALTVQRYLVREHGIEASRLKITGQGKREPINPADPLAAENRRVQFSGA
jgi:outer membrane protein OmpA-like peptidoglycan-associated protein